jgi:hypothetical protein
LEPPSPADFPTAGSQISKLKPPKDPVLPFVELPRPLQESGIIGKGGAAGFLGKAYDPYRMYQDPAEKVTLEDLSLRKDMPKERLKDRFELLKGINGSMGDLEKALAARRWMSIRQGVRLGSQRKVATRWTFRRPAAVRDGTVANFGQSVDVAEADRSRHPFVQMNWPSVANGNAETDSWDTHASNFGPLKNLHCPKLTRRWSALLEDMDQRGLLKETMVVAVGEFRRAAHGRLHQRQQQQPRRARPLAVLLQRRCRRSRNRARHAVWRIGRHRVEPEGKAGSPERPAGDDVLCPGDRPRYGDSQPSQPAA